jgi:hypothetical protein
MPATAGTHGQLTPRLKPRGATRAAGLSRAVPGTRAGDEACSFKTPALWAGEDLTPWQWIANYMLPLQ